MKAYLVGIDFGNGETAAYCTPNLRYWQGREEKPKAEGSYTNPEQPPEYIKEQTVIEEKPKTNVTPNSRKTQASSGKVYIDGFGYVEKAGQTKTQTGVSNGDINKMVGSMD